MKLTLLASMIFVCLAAFAGMCHAGDYVTSPCAPQVAPQTIEAIIGVESSGDPLAIHVNSRTKVFFPKPRSREQAIKIANRLITAGYSVDCGLMQVNSQHLSPSGITTSRSFRSMQEHPGRGQNSNRRLYNCGIHLQAGPTSAPCGFIGI